MIPHSYATDTQTKAAELAATVASSVSPAQIVSACAAVEAFLRKHTPGQHRWFFSITFPTLICRVFGFDDSSPPSSAPAKRQPSNGWIDVAVSENDSELAGKIFSLLSPNGVLLSSISGIDRLSLVKYVFPTERLPEWVRYMLQNERDCRVLTDLCPLFKNKIKEDSIKGSSYQVGELVLLNSGLSSAKREIEKKTEGNLFIRLLYVYLHSFVPVQDLNVHQPYRSSLLHYSPGYDGSAIERAEFVINTMIHFWLVDNDFSPLPAGLCKAFGVTFPFRSVLGETPPTSGLGDVINVFVKYLNLSSLAAMKGSNQIEYGGSPGWRVSGSFDVVKSRDAPLNIHSVGSWNLLIQRPLYRFILRTFLFCPVETSIKNVASQAFSIWVNYMEPWSISFEEFADLNEAMGLPNGSSANSVSKSSSLGYSSMWQGFILDNYLFYSSLVMHFIGFAHKFLHTDAEVIVQMVSKVINILSSSSELMNLIKNVDSVFHSKAAESSKSMLSSLNRYVPTIREQLQDWEDGLCESDADGSFLHENWNKDLRLFADGEDGGQQLLQLFLLRAESELQSISGNNLAQNLQCLDSLKAQLSQLFGGPIGKPSPGTAQSRHCQQSRDDIFKPRSRLNEKLGLNRVDDTQRGTGWSYVEVQGGMRSVYGPMETLKVVFYSLLSWIMWLVEAGVRFMRTNGEEHHFESKANPTASKTSPQQAGTIRKNGYIVMKKRPCKVVEVSTSKLESMVMLNVTLLVFYL
ncbi:UNVERIFIED_CONTAM: Eukaryotic translation initiation factor 5A-2, partial [Sesamum calycinum]